MKFTDTQGAISSFADTETIVETYCYGTGRPGAHPWSKDSIGV